MQRPLQYEVMKIVAEDISKLVVYLPLCSFRFNKGPKSNGKWGKLRNA